jgi:formamidopyrimidine-DNA glycosylase
MIELPEATTLATQATASLAGRTVTATEVDHTPHRLTWYFGDPERYPDLLTGRRITGARAVAGHVQIEAGELRILCSDGAYPRRYAPDDVAPAKHQLRLDLDDGSTLAVTVAMYGGIQVFHDGENDNPYYAVALVAPSPLTAAFDADHWAGLLAADGAASLSAKAFLATGQRIPGLGNGVLQDVLWTARVNPRRKVATLSDDERSGLLDAVRTILAAMTDQGGRDTERDLFGRPGGYPTVMSRVTLERPCPRCGGRVVKEAYLGGAVYYCPACQPL